MAKKAYNLRDIEKILTYSPPLFIVFFAIASMLVSFFILQHQEKSQIALVTQKQKFISQNELRKYITSVNAQIDAYLDQKQKELKRSVYTLGGLYRGIYAKAQSQSLLRDFIKEIEQSGDINFVVFDKDLQLLYGQNLIESVSRLIFSKKDDETSRRITLMYIASQGRSTSMSWKNDLSNTVQLSHFEQSFDGAIYIGAFSQTDSLRNLIKTAFLQSIREDALGSENFYFWLYDGAQKKIYNLNNQKRWQIKPTINKDAIAQEIPKSFFSVGIEQNIQKVDTNISQEITQIQNDFAHKRNITFAIIFASTLVLITASTLFLEFIKKIFTSFNRRFENKNRLAQRLKERYELAIIASNDGLWDTNFQTQKTFFSKKWLTMLGYQSGDISSYEQWLEKVHVDDRSRVAMVISEHLEHKKSGHLVCEYRIKTKHNGYKWILARGKVFFDEKMQARRLLMMSMDIDEKKLADEKMQERISEAVRKNQEKEKLLIQQNKLAAMGEMIGSIAHQWRQPLNNISLILHFIRDNAHDPKFAHTQLADYVNRAKKQITYMSETIDDFRNFYKPSKNKELFDLKSAIISTLGILQTTLEKNQILLDISGESTQIYGYENEFKQAILNILSNAKDAIRAKKRFKEKFQGRIDIRLYDMQERSKITIANNGGEASDEVLARMFEPYFTTKFQDKGTGIGLYMTKAIIEESLGGEIFAKNHDEGVLFGIILRKGCVDD